MDDTRPGGYGDASDAAEGDGEPRLDSGGFSLDLDQEQPDDRIEEPFDPNEIDVRTRTMTVDLLLARLRRGILDLAPDFQRNSGIWREKHKSRLIESLLLRIPLPSFYAAENEDEEWAVVDGVQRLTTIARFVNPESIGANPLILRDLEYLDYNGYSYSDLPGRLQTRLDETEVLIHLIGKATPEEVKFNIFGRINTGGLPLSRQELRHALIPGPARGLLAELAASSDFQRATHGSVRDARMSDREMVLRFLAFRLFEPADYKSQDLDDFLRQAMKQINQLPEDRIAELKADFRWAMGAATEVFGEHAFRKRTREQTTRNPINKALFEAVAVNLAKRSDAELAVLTTNREDVRGRLADLLAESEFNDAISVATGDRGKVRRRFTALDELFTEVTDA